MRQDAGGFYLSQKCSINPDGKDQYTCRRIEDCHAGGCTALDLIGYVGHCAGLDNVATVLAELAEKIDAGKLQKLAELSPIAWVQRLGYLLDLVGNKDKAQGIAEYVMEKRPVRTPLAPAISSMGAKMDSRWRVFVNTKVEPDL